MEEFRKNPPAPLVPVPFNVPPPKISYLSNGLKLVVLEDRRFPLVSFRLFVRSGEVNDPAELPGVTSAMASLLCEGTTTLSSLEIAEEIDLLGASLYSASGYDTTSISASALSIHRRRLLEIMSNVIVNPSFPEHEVDLYRRNTVESLKFQRSQPGFLADEQTAGIIFGNHAYSRVSPSVADVERLGRDALVKHHTASMLPNNAVLTAVGDVDADELANELESHFGAWKSADVLTADLGIVPTRSARSITVVDRPDSAQASVVIANSAFRRNHPDYFSVAVMNQILGAGAASRIFMNIREEKGYTYGAYSKFDLRCDAGIFEASAEVRTAVTGAALTEFFYELERIREDEVNPDELRDAKSYLTGIFPIRAETQEGLTAFIVQQQVFDLPEDYMETYRRHVDAVTSGEVLEAARKHVRPAEAAVVIVGDAAEIVPQVAGFADSVSVVDRDGNRIDG